MEELKVKLIGLGLSDEIASQAITMMGEFLKSKVPAEYQSILNSFLAGQAADISSLGGGVMDKVKGLFGGN